VLQDPFKEYTDVECLEALHRVHLRTSESRPTTAAPSRTASTSDLTSTLENSQSNTLVASGSGSGSDSGTLAASVSGNKNIVTLESKVSEGGGNFSAGQKQLISMARA